MYDEVIDTLAFDSVDLALRIMILECANSVMTSVISYFVPVCLKLGDF